MKSHEFIKEDGAGDYQQMLSFVSRHKTPGVPDDQQVALALYKELQKQQQTNDQLGKELASAEQRIDTATQRGQLGKQGTDLDRERQDLDKQRSVMGQIDAENAKREKANAHQIQHLTAQLTDLQKKPGVSSAESKALEKQIKELTDKGMDADKFRAVQISVTNIQQMQKVDNLEIKHLVDQLRTATKSPEPAAPAPAVTKELEKTDDRTQSELDSIKKQLDHFKGIERKVAALTPLVMDIQDTMQKVEKLDKENEHIYQELQKHDALLNKRPPPPNDNDGNGEPPPHTKPPVAPPSPAPAPGADYDALEKDDSSRAKALAAMAKARLINKPEPVYESKLLKAIKWATGKK